MEALNTSLRTVGWVQVVLVSFSKCSSSGPCDGTLIHQASLTSITNSYNGNTYLKFMKAGN